MSIKKISKRDIFAVASFILIICCIDQLYMLCRYDNMNVETFILTIFLTGLNIYFGFIKK